MTTEPAPTCNHKPAKPPDLARNRENNQDKKQPKTGTNCANLGCP